MNFESEPTGYEKTAVSDLQGSWGNLRDAVVENYGFCLLYTSDAADE